MRAYLSAEQVAELAELLEDAPNPSRTGSTPPNRLDCRPADLETIAAEAGQRIQAALDALTGSK
jgi:hypothetical protein